MLQPYIFVLTLEDAAARRKPLIKKLERLGLDYELWFGVDGRRGLPLGFESQIDRAVAREKLFRTMTDAEFACALSHRAIYQAICDRSLPSAVVLEDDAILAETFAGFLSNYHEPPCDLLMLGHLKSRVARWGAIQLGHGFKAYRLLSNSQTTTGYYLTRSAAKSILTRSTPISYVADWPCDIASLDSRAIHPRLVNRPVEGSGSHIEDQRTAQKGSGRTKRFLKPLYWKTWWIKRTSKHLK